MSIFDKIFGTYSDRELKRIRPIADKVMALEDDMAKHLMIFFLRHLL